MLRCLPVHPLAYVNVAYGRVFCAGEGATGNRSGVAPAEKALFDTVYLASARGGRVSLSEMELPEGFGGAALERWVARVPSARLRTLVGRNLDAVLSYGV